VDGDQSIQLLVSCLELPLESVNPDTLKLHRFF
jgi:hypothetical protein